jgi:hypothetical protein
MPTAETLDAIARALVLAMFPAIEAALLDGLRYRDILAATAAEAGPAWSRDYGPDVAAAALRTLATLPIDAPFTAPGRRRWIEAAPVGPLPPRTPVVEIAAAPPVEAIGGWRQFWAGLLRGAAR